MSWGWTQEFISSGFERNPENGEYSRSFLKNKRTVRICSTGLLLVQRGRLLTPQVYFSAVWKIRFSLRTHLRERQMEPFSRWSWITVIKKTQTAPQSQPNMRAGQYPDSKQSPREWEIRYWTPFINHFHSLFSLWSGRGTLCWRGVKLFFSLHSVEIWLLLIRFSAALAEFIWRLDTLF